MLVCKLPEGVFLLFSCLLQLRVFQLLETQVWKEIGVRVNAVSGRIHPLWLHVVIKHKILPCTNLRPAVKVTSYSSAVL